MNSTDIGIIMGSDSDFPIMKDALEICDFFSVKYEVNIVSAHRTPIWMFEYAREAQSRGLQVIIAGAGGAAHLPGMTASLTQIPVIGVPIKTKTMNGLDSLYSIVQMPGGIPVATVAINGSKNAALLAIRILALQNPDLANRLAQFQLDQERAVLDKNQALHGTEYQNKFKEKSE